MKNRKLVCTVLLILILIFVGIAACYGVVNFRTYNASINGEDLGAGTQEDEYPAISNSVLTVTNYDDFNYYMKQNYNVFMVFGKQVCHFCSLYKPVLERVQKEYNRPIVYVDLSELSREDYSKVLNSSLVIPAKCTNVNADTPISQGFGTPLSLFVNNGEVYDCIRGYKDYDTLVGLLKNIGYIK